MATAVLKLFVGQGSMMDGQRGDYILFGEHKNHKTTIITLQDSPCSFQF